jgi:hypothetical protein
MGNELATSEAAVPAPGRARYLFVLTAELTKSRKDEDQSAHEGKTRAQRDSAASAEKCRGR